MPICSACRRSVEEGAVACPTCGAATDQVAGKRIGTRVAGRYFVHQLLGRGGMADVYKATDLTQDRPVALKILRRTSLPGDDGPRRFRRELETASRLHHPNSVEVFDFGFTADGSAYLSMEFIPGRTLAEEIAGGVALREERALRITAQILSALAEAHHLGIVHRDLKPANVMIDPLRGEGDHVTVLDFGIATLGDQPTDERRLTQRGLVFGTPAYMSPEQIRGEPLDPRSDLYSVGVMLFEMLTGTLPFESPAPMGLAVKHLTEPPPRPGERRPAIALVPEVEALVMQALQKDRTLRPASALAMRAQILQSHPEGSGETPAVLPPTAPFPILGGGDRSGEGTGAHEFRGRGLSWRRGRWVAALAVPGALALAIAGLAIRHGSDRFLSTAAEPESAARASTMAVEVRPEPPASALAATSYSPPVAKVAPPEPPAGVRKAKPAAAMAPAGMPTLGSGPATAIRLIRGELNSIATPPALTGDGVLVLEATPWAEVSIDGTRLGETPREVRLSAGRYRLKAVHPELGAREEQVSVQAGERRLWSVTFEP
jgi:hypothetical protein